MFAPPLRYDTPLNRDGQYPKKRIFSRGCEIGCAVMGKKHPMTFADKIAKLKKEHKLSYSSFADEVGVDRGKPDRWINRGVQPSLADALKVAQRFNVPLEYLADDEIVELPRQPEPPSVWRATLEEQIRDLGADGERIASRALTIYTEPTSGTSEPDRSVQSLVKHWAGGTDGHHEKGGGE